MFNLQPYIYVMTEKVSKPRVLFCLPIVRGTCSSMPFPVFSLESLQDRGPGPTRCGASWHLSHRCSVSAAAVLDFTSSRLFFFRIQSSQGLCVQIVIYCKDNIYFFIYIYLHIFTFYVPTATGGILAAVPGTAHSLEKRQTCTTESGFPRAFCSADTKACWLQ